jgi:cell division septum initiation protein DivIVA
LNDVKRLDVLDLLDEIEDMLENVSSVPFTGKIMLDRNELIDIISKISTKIPEEYQHVKYLFKNREEILANAEKEAQIIIENAKKKEGIIFDNINVKKKELNIKFTQEHNKLVDDSEIVLRANNKAKEIIENAKIKANEMRNSSFDYSREILLKSRNNLNEKIIIFDKNISELDKMK